MKKTGVFALLFFYAFAITCNKPVDADKIRYEVTLTDAATWHGSYLNATAQVVGLTNANNGWKHEFRNTSGLIVLALTAYPDCIIPGCDALMKIYINNNLVAEGWSSVMPQVMYQY